jgi:hypothetical protein
LNAKTQKNNCNRLPKRRGPNSNPPFGCRENGGSDGEETHQKQGAACLLVEGGRFLFLDWPKDRYAIVLSTLDDWCANYNIRGAYLEKAQAGVFAKGGKPGASVSMFSYGMNYGAWLCLLTLAGIEFQLVTPQAWRKNLVTKADGMDTKDQAANVVKNLFPDQYEQGVFLGPLGGWKDGRADAALIAYKALLDE